MEDSELLERIGIAIKALRTKKGLTQQALSELCKVDRGFISSVERGTRNVSILTLCLMINNLGEDFVSFIKAMDDIQ
ncbi:MAG: helix-turn-helix transcriptional regulator [Akkermansia sp.]|nr:helix-turn-helix transcriptional regulator [Akkermansia sp.]